MQKKIATLLILVTMFLSSYCYSSSVIPVDLEKMSRKAGRIFHGHCTGINVTRDERGLMATEVTYEVLRSVKGAPSKSITFKVFGVATGDVTVDRPSKTAGMTQFYPGREDVLFLYEESPWGFTSPIGLWQGDFPVVRIDGEPRLSRTSQAYKNAITFQKSKTGPIKKEIVTPDDLLDEVEEIISVR